MTDTYALYDETKCVQGNQMNTRSIDVLRLTYTSASPFAEVLARLASKIGHPDMRKFKRDTRCSPGL
jgi:hypothetical protein